MNCCLYKEYERAKKNVLKEVKKQRKRKEYEEEIDWLVDFALSELDDPSIDYWIVRARNKFCRQMQFIDTDDCISFIADFTDGQICEKSQSSKFDKYCLIVRDVARIMCEKGKERA